MFNICLNASPSPVFTNRDTNEVQPPLWPTCAPRHICCFPTVMHPLTTTDSKTRAFVFRVWVLVSGKRKTLRLLFAIVTIFQSGWLTAVGANAWCYRTGIPGSDIIFPHDVSPQKCKKKENKKYVAQPDCQQQNGHEKLKTHQCLLYALCFCSSSVCGQFIGLAIVPLEKMPDLKAAPGVTPEKVSLWEPGTLLHRSRI